MWMFSNPCVHVYKIELFDVIHFAGAHPYLINSYNMAASHFFFFFSGGDDDNKTLRTQTNECWGEGSNGFSALTHPNITSKAFAISMPSMMGMWMNAYYHIFIYYMVIGDTASVFHAITIKTFSHSNEYLWGGNFGQKAMPGWFIST